MARAVANVEDKLRRILSDACGSVGYCNSVPYPSFLVGLEGQVAQRVCRPLACLVACSGDVYGLCARARRIAVSRGSSDCNVVLSICSDSASGFGQVNSATCVLPVGGLRSDRVNSDGSVYYRIISGNKISAKCRM